MTMISYIITGIVLLAVFCALIAGMWKASKYLVIPTQILIFIALIFIVIKVFFTSDNVRAFNREIKKSGIVESQITAAKNIVTAPRAEDGSASEKTDEPAPPRVPIEPEKVSAAVKDAPVAAEGSKKIRDDAPGSVPAPRKELDPIDFL